jgi:hypothetical protein
LDRAIAGAVSDTGCELKLRELAARLLRDAGRDTSAFFPLLTEFIAAGDARDPELCLVIRSMNYGRGRLGRCELQILHSTLSSGTSEQRYWVVNEITFFTDYHDRRKVRHALIESLEDRAAPAEVRGWAAERLSRYTSQETVRAYIRAVKDPSPEVRLWAVCTLGCAAPGWGVPLCIEMLWRRCWSKRWRTMPLCRDGGRSAAQLRFICHSFTEALRKSLAGVY